MSWLRRGKSADDDGPTVGSPTDHPTPGGSSAWGSDGSPGRGAGWGASTGEEDPAAGRGAGWGGGWSAGSGAGPAGGDGDPAPAPAHSPPLAQGSQEPPRQLVYALALGLSGIWLLLDQATKVLALANLGDGSTISFGPIDLHAVKNQGGAFGLDPGFFPGLFVVVTLAVLVLIARALPRTDRLSLAAAYGLIGGGALGNLVDRLFRDPGFPRGAVVDFVDLGWWPVFNLADVGIVVGALVLALLLVKVDRQERAAEPRDEDAGKREARQVKREARKAQRQAKREGKRERKGKTEPAGHAAASMADDGVAAPAQQEPAASGS